MSLSVAFIERLEDLLEPARQFLSRDGDIFARPRIVVPNAGTQAWLQDRLTRTLGTSGPGRGDGVVANVELLYPAAITALLQPPRDPRQPDPWSLDRLTLAVLHVITSAGLETVDIPLPIRTEPLLAARRIAAAFDEYHVRRPGMILEWERGKGNPVLAPTANDVQHDGHPVPASLQPSDLWQFEVWRAVRQLIGIPSPPARRSVDHLRRRDRLLVAGLESLSLPQVQCLEELGTVCDVEVILVHPSPGLKKIWATGGRQPLRDDLRDRPLQKIRDPEFPAGVDPLLPVWLSGSHELQDLLAARAVSVTELPSGGHPPRSDSLLARMQRTVASGGLAIPASHDPATDRSVTIHRCHSLSRQAEVLHDALLDAFATIQGLEPHDVAIVSPCLEQAAPHLQAVFQRTVRGQSQADGHPPITLPLAIADRGLRETSPAADLLAAVLALPGSRGSIDDVLAVAGHPLVRTAFGVTDETVATWTDFLDRTKVRWGLDAGHRTRHGLDLPDHAEIHTWKLGLERMLLGAVLPDALPQPELGGVVPLTDLDPVDLVPITRLVRILDIIRTLDATTSDRRPIAAWCDAIEQALVALCGDRCPDLAEPLQQLRRLRQAAAGTVSQDHPVPFEDVHRLLVAWLDEKAGRQPVLSGSITASSMVSLRGVPSKVVCVIGYDDGAVGVGEADGDDLVARQQLLGDVDPRADQRRALLDCLLAAGERLVITCTGRSVKSNKRLPLVTPLAEFVDFAVRHGVHRERFDDVSGIELEHPRHHLSRRNFEEGGVAASGVWSHDRVAAGVIAEVEREAASGGTATPAAVIPVPGSSLPASAPQPPPAGGPSSGDVVELSLLERMVKDPLSLYLSQTLGLDTWRAGDDVTPATLPTSLVKSEIRKLVLDLLAALARDPRAGDAWVAAKHRGGELPVGPHVRRQVAEIVALADGLLAGLREHSLDPLSLTAPKLEDCPQVGRYRVVGPLPGVHAAPDQLVVVTADTCDGHAYGRPLHMAALHLLVARAAAIDVDCLTIISRRDEWKLGKMKPPSPRFPNPRPIAAWQARVVRLRDTDMSQAAAASRLDDIVGLAMDAVKSPRPAFGQVLTAAAAQREAEFERTIGSEFYGRSSEAVFFGASPTFADVFTAVPARLTFLDDVGRLLCPTHDSKSGEYLLA